MKVALCILYRELKARQIPFKFVLNVHDEWQIEVLKGTGDVVGKLGVWAIEEAGKQLNLRCPLSGEYRVGKNWYETH